MYKIYFKQAIELLRQNKFISIISITGTALAIMMVMVLILVSQVKNADVSPESNRSKLLYMSRQSKVAKKANSTRNGALEYEVIKGLSNAIKSAEVISTIEISWKTTAVRLGESKTNSALTVMATDAIFWQIMAYDFITGKPFSQADFDSGIKNAVITQRVAKQAFGMEEAIGKNMYVNNAKYRVVGVVKDVSKAFTYAYGEVWIPYTSKINYQNESNYQILIKSTPENRQNIEQEVRSYEQMYNTNSEAWDIQLFGPYNHKDSQLNVWELEKDKKQASNRLIFLFSMLLLIPAINLSGLSLSRVRRRMEEIGIRKAFGATKQTILTQILFENFITSLIGGFIGLILSMIVIVLLKGWLLGADDANSIPLDALISVPAIVAVIAVSFILNLLSSGIPAWRAANMNIVDSLNRNNN